MKFHHRIYLFIVFKLLYLQKLRELKKHFSSKTPYSVVENLNVTQTKKFGKPYKIWMIIRHGSRFPSIGQVNKMNAELPLIQKKIIAHSKDLSNFEMELLLRATIKYSNSNCSRLTPTGRCEMRSLAKRMQNRFPNLLLPKYDNVTYQFRLTNTDRTLESAQQFAVGLFGEVVDNNVEFITDEKFLRFYKMCAKWRNEIRYNSSILREQELFQNSTIAKSAVKNLNKKVLGSNNALTFDDIETMYKACITETCNNRITAWCVPFDFDIVKVIEFSEDLKHYWLDGYGFRISSKQACPLFKNMMDFFTKDEDSSRVVLNFTHSGALLKMISHLQLYKDVELLKHNSFSNNRKWRISQIGGFGSNITFVLYKIKAKSKILVLHQEKVIRLPCCPNDDLCDFDIVKKYYKSSLIDCNFDKICDNF